MSDLNQLLLIQENRLYNIRRLEEHLGLIKATLAMLQEDHPKDLWIPMLQRNQAQAEQELGMRMTAYNEGQAAIAKRERASDNRLIRGFLAGTAIGMAVLYLILSFV